MSLIDLHIHSLFSDGSDSIKQIIQQAKAKHLDLIALTDHNTLSGIDDFKKYAKLYHQDVLAGIELSTMYHHKEIHLLGYFSMDSDFHSSKFDALYQYLEDYKQTKTIQNDAIIERLSQIFHHISRDDFYSFTNSHNINRVHIAKYLVFKGYVHDIQEAFLKYIGDNCCCYVKRQPMSLKKGIEVIKQAGGIAIIAHLGQYHFDDQKLIEFMQWCINNQIDGFECYHPSNDAHIVEMIQQYANSKILTAGSDYHGAHKKNHPMGISCHYPMNSQQERQYLQTINHAYLTFKKYF